MTLVELLTMIFALMLTLGAPLIVISLLCWHVYRKRQTHPPNAPRGDRTARCSETLALAGLSLSMLTLLALYRSYDGIPYPLTENAPATVRQEYWTMLGIWVGVIGCCLAIAWFYRTALAAWLLFGFFCIAGYFVNAGTVFSHHGNEDEIRETLVPLTVKIKGDVQGADVWFNGVHLGKTPLEADLDDVLSRIPNWNDSPPKEFQEFEHFLQNRHGVFRPLAWFHVNEPSRVGINDARTESRAIYARVELNGERLYSMSSHEVTGGSRIFGAITPCEIQLHVFLPKWRDDVDSLLLKAQLVDYEVDSEWYDAMATYADLGWNELRRRSAEDPGFDRAADAWATAKYDLDSVTNSTAAWAVVQRIQEEALQAGYYTDSLAGRALELVVPKLDRQFVVDHAERRLRSLRTQPGGSLRYGTVNDRFHFGTYDDGSWQRGPLTPADVVLAHAVWRLDVAYDQEDDAVDNPIERRIVPVLLRLGNGRGTPFSAAEGLGGSIFERFVLRHNWRSKPDDSTDFNDKLRIATVEVNRWLAVAARMTSPAGTKFRQEHPYEVLRLAEEVMQDGMEFQHSFGDSINFLFIDQGTDGLASQFWPRFQQLATRESHNASQASHVRWSYLVRQQPYCDVDDFVASYRPYGDERCPKQVLTQLDPEFQYEVLMALLHEADDLVSESKSGTSSHGIRDANRNDFAEMARMVPCEASAVMMMAWLSESPGDEARRVERIRRAGDASQLSDHHLQALADAGEPRFRELALASIQRQPTRERRAILRRLEEDNDPEVRDQAKVVRDHLESIRHSPLPRRQ